MSQSPWGFLCQQGSPSFLVDEAGPALPGNLRRPTSDSYAAVMTLLMACPFSLVSKPVTTVRVQHAPGGQVQSVTWEESADKKESLDFDNLFNQNQGISMGVHTNDLRSGRKEPDFRRHSFTQLLGILAIENSHLSSSIGVGLCWRDFLEQPASKYW